MHINSKNRRILNVYKIPKSGSITTVLEIVFVYLLNF